MFFLVESRIILSSLAAFSQAVAAAFRSAASHGGREPVPDVDTQAE